MQTSLKILIRSLILYFNFVRLNASELIVSLPDIQMESTLIPCKNDSDCQTLKDAVCLNDYCNCNGTKSCSDILEFKVTILGEQCRQSSNCHIEHSVCLDDICQCDTGMVPSLNKKECLKESPSNCTKLGNCSQSIDCPRGFVGNSESTKCLQVPQILQSSCREDAQCSEQFGNAVCINATTCQCQPSYQYDNISKKCINLEINCREDKDCLDNEQEEDANLFSCVMGVCKSCFEDEELCKNRPETGPCLEHSCNGSSANNEFRTCNTGRCECPEERQFCANSAKPDGVRIRGHPVQKYYTTVKPTTMRPFTKVRSANKRTKDTVNVDTTSDTENTNQTEDNVVKISTKPIWYRRPVLLITFGLIFFGVICLGTLVLPTFIEIPRYTDIIQYFSAVNLAFIACSMLWMMKYYQEVKNLLTMIVFIFFSVLSVAFVIFVRGFLVNYINTRIPPDYERLRIKRRGYRGYYEVYTLPDSPPPGEPVAVPGERRDSSNSSISDSSQLNVCIAGPSSRPDYPRICVTGPTSPRAGPSSRPDEPSSRRERPSSHRDGPSSPRAGPSSRPDYPRICVAGPSSPRAGPSSRLYEPSSRRERPSSRRDGPSSPRAGPSSRPDEPSTPRAGPSSRPDEPSTPRAGPSSRPDEPSSRRDWPSIPRAGPSSPRAGPCIRRDGPSSPRAGPSSRPDEPSTARAGPSSRRDRPSDRRDGPSSPRAGPSSRPREKPISPRSGPSDRHEAPKSHREGPSSRPDAPSSRRHAPSCRPDELSSRRDVDIPVSDETGAVCLPDRRATRSREPLIRSDSQPEDLRSGKKPLRASVYESSV